MAMLKTTTQTITIKKAGKKASEYYQAESISEGFSFYLMVGETYHISRLKRKMHQAFKKAVAKLVATGKNHLRVLDIGCDTGTDLFMLPKIEGVTFERVGSDISTGAVTQAKQLAKKRNENKIDFVIADANQKQPFKEGSFDIVISSEVIEHIANPIQFLNEVYRLLSDHGAAIISTPNEKCFQKFVLHKLLPKKLEAKLVEARRPGFARHGDNTNMTEADWDAEAHISVYGAQQWKGIVKQSKLSLSKMTGSAFYGGLPMFDQYPFLIGSLIILDSIIDKLPLQPHLQTCLIMHLEKN